MTTIYSPDQISWAIAGRVQLFLPYFISPDRVPQERERMQQIRLPRGWMAVSIQVCQSGIELVIGRIQPRNYRDKTITHYYIVADSRHARIRYPRKSA